MLLYKDKDISISTIIEEDIGNVLKYFSENTFCCGYETGSLRPTNSQFLTIMKNIVSGKDDENNILVVRKNNNVIGYASLFVDYDRLVIGHIVIDEKERSKGYGRRLVELIVRVAESDGRNVSLFCLHPNSVFKKMGFDTIGTSGTNYIYRNSKELNNYPKIFVDKQTYKMREEERHEMQVERFKKFLNSETCKIINNLDSDYFM